MRSRFRISGEIGLVLFERLRIRSSSGLKSYSKDGFSKLERSWYVPNWKSYDWSVIH